MQTWWRDVRRKEHANHREESPLKLEVFNIDQLERYARDLASLHELDPASGRDPLLPRLADNERVLADAYADLCEAVHAKRRISPAGEWILDNFHLIEEQIELARRHLPKGYSQELPRIASGPDAGLPRVYSIALEVIAHVDGRIDGENITAFVAAYQQVAPLNLGEYWAVPIMLRLGLIENLRRVAALVVRGMADRKRAVHWADEMLRIAEADPKRMLLSAADMARANPPLSTAFVAEFVRRLHGQSTALDIPLAWIEQQLAENDSTTAQAIQLESQQQAANQVSVGASIGSLRFLAAIDWRDFVESLSGLEQELRRDPAQVYAAMDFATRDHYRHVVERLAKRCKLSEVDVARKAIELAKAGGISGGDRLGHVGYYLIDDGLKQLEAAIHSPVVRLEPRVRFALYIGAIVLLTCALTSIVASKVAGFIAAQWVIWLIALLTLGPASQVAVALINWIATASVKPWLLPRMDFSHGIPPEHRTLIAVPCMLNNPRQIERLLGALEVRYLANRKAHLHFALVTDFCDADRASLPGDEAVVALAVCGIQALNAKYAANEALKDVDSNGLPRVIFYLFHRAREWNAQEKLWMGYERKRGKLEALNALLRGRPSPSNPDKPPFHVVEGDPTILLGVKYVITLDSDTLLPPDAAQLLVATIAHPQNRPVYDTNAGRVTSGYGILQPRVAVSLPGSRRSWYVRLSAGDAGIDPYTRAVSDVYQDLFREGSFVGKGIYDVDAFTTSLAGKLPENRILSHDLLEGSYARCGLVSDIQLYEEHPCDYGEDAKRRHRWTRGDWQIASWLLPTVPGPHGRRLSNPLSPLSKWKIFDNLRRSGVALATTALLVLGWLKLEHSWFFVRVILTMTLLPPILTTLAEAMRKAPEASLRWHLQSTGHAILRNFVQGVLNVVFLPYEALLNLDAMVRSWLRMVMTRRHLLEWQSPIDPADSARFGSQKSLRSMASASVVGVVLIVVFSLWHPSALIRALPFLSLWILSPVIATWLSRVLPQRENRLNAEQLALLGRLSRSTWRFFETFVGAKDNFLPPDNFQEYPVPVVAHRTSPTNIGLSLLANLAAYDFGYVPGTALVDRTSKTFTTMGKMRRFRGHFYNWYDTLTLEPLLPLYVSTVDSGNLAGMLLTLKPGLKELAGQTIIGPNVTRGLADTAGILREALVGSPDAATRALAKKCSPLHFLLRSPLKNLVAAKAVHAMVQHLAGELAESVNGAHDTEAKWWLHALEKQARECIEEPVIVLAPWSQLPAADLAGLPNDVAEKLQRILTLHEVAMLPQQLLPVIDEMLLAPNTGTAFTLLRQAVIDGGAAAAGQILAIEALMQLCEEFSVFEYDFLYDTSRHLLAIGHNVSEHRRDTSHYDLLASEARLCSFVGIAQGLLPQEHWFSLGRLITTSHGEPALLSWSGSMFEYLMPQLIMPTFDNTLLDETYKTCVKMQIEYCKARHVPWGISESGYNATDAQLNYQYRAFGVPGLGFKRGLADDLVITPYASVMALMVDPEAAFANMERMIALDFKGSYGFYEAIDYTPVRLPLDQTRVVVKSFMAHHQGMSLLALAYHLHDRKMPKRFRSDPLFMAVELLLHERVPKAGTLHPHALEVAGAARLVGEREALLRIISTPDTPRPEVHLLSNGRYTVMVTNAGGGFSRWKDLALTRWREDPTCDNWGTFCFVRDVTSGAVWSAAHQPSLAGSTHYEAIFPQARAEFRRRNRDFEMHTEITVSPEDDIELRRFSVTNLSSTRRMIELTSYAEVVLATQAADEAHQAFSNLFVQTEIVKDRQAILCTRRPRSHKEAAPTMLHLMTVHGTAHGELSFETNRLTFIGRGRNIASPLAMEQETLSGSEGSVLDPIVAIRCRIVLEPEQTVKIHSVTGIGETREAALALMEKYHDRHLADRVFELAQTHRQVVLRQLNISESDAQLFSKLASSVLYANPVQRPSRTILSKNRRGQSALWSYGISGDLPIVMLKASDREKLDLLRQMIQAHGYWRTMGIATDLVIWNEDDSGYRQVLQEQIMALITASSGAHLVDKPGGIFVRRVEQMSEDDRNLLQTVARAVLSDKAGSLMEQVERRGRVPHLLPPFKATREPSNVPVVAGVAPARLLFENGMGGFSPDGKEYVITTSTKSLTPAPWVNVLANPFFGTVLSESGAAYTWCENAHEFRLTPWHNDVVTDNSGEAFYCRDEATGEYWSPMPFPARAAATYVTRHGFGYSLFQVTAYGIRSELTLLVAIDAPVKIALLKVRNTSGRRRRISVTGYCEWVLGELRAKSLLHVTTEVDPTSQALFARNPYHPEFGGRIAFFDVSESQRVVTCDRTEFIGRNGRLAKPAAMRHAQLSGRTGAALDACAAMQTFIELGDDEEREIAFVLGVGRDVDDVHTLLRRFRSVGAAHAAFDDVRRYWGRNLAAVQVKTPDPSIDVLMNGWLLYQVQACRLWARSGFYQSGGAFGFRDQLQDAMALVHSEPAMLRAHLLRAAARQFREGDVQHWWHPPSGRGVRTHFSDDYLWLPLAVSRYVLSIGDTGVLDVRVPFVEGRQVKPDEESYFDLPITLEESATLYEHCVRAINHGLRYGQHGLPLIGSGDWNDGMNLVGEHGRGESVWLGFFLYDVLGQFGEVARRRGDAAFAATCTENRALLQEALEQHGWDGDWYRRAYFDDGRPLGSASNTECQIDSLPQSWSVLSGAADPARAKQAMAAMSKLLVDRENRLVKLFHPPFDTGDMNPGYIKGYVPGVRENGGQYTHAAIWSAMAFAALGDHEKAWELVGFINPVSHSNSAEAIATYKVEPYVMAADVYAAPAHIGRGGWTWYTGAASWMYRLILESLLGLRLDIDQLHFAPCLPPDWKTFDVHYRYRETEYHIVFQLGAGTKSGRPRISLDGQAQEHEALRLVDDRVAHTVEVHWD